MSEPGSPTPLEAVTGVLSGLLDVVQEVKQAHRKVPERDSLHPEIDALFSDLGRWARLLLEEEQDHGVSPLETMPSVAGRRPPVLWAGEPGDDEVRDVVGRHLALLDEHVSAALAGPDAEDADVRAALEEVHAGLRRHLDALRSRS